MFKAHCSGIGTLKLIEKVEFNDDVVSMMSYVRIKSCCARDVLETTILGIPRRIEYVRTYLAKASPSPNK